MACTSRYAEAWEFIAFWCRSAVLKGADDSGGAGNAFLTDTGADFQTAGVQANQDMVLYNTTQGTSGPVTARTATTLTATGVTWDDGDAYRIVVADGVELSTVEHYLDIAAGDLHAALAQSGQCDCTFATWAPNFLAKLNIIDAAAYYNCDCGHPHLSDEMRQSYLEWASTQLEAIRTGTLDLCHGATGADWPAVGWAEQSWTTFTAAEILYNEILRNSD